MSSRSDSSLALLTKKFVALIEASPKRIINIKHAAEALSVKKRRLYDITNVLEGIGLLKRHSKNSFEWIAVSTSENDNDYNEVTTSQQADTADFLQESARLDLKIQNAVKARSALINKHSSLLYLTQEDIRTVFKQSTVLIIHAPTGTILEVGDPGQSLPPRYNLRLKSENVADGIEVRCLASSTQSSIIDDNLQRLPVQGHDNTGLPRKRQLLEDVDEKREPATITPPLPSIMYSIDEAYQQEELIQESKRARVDPSFPGSPLL